jgi:hypothetical protein
VINESEEDAGIVHTVSYTGNQLPVRDDRKFFAKITAECMTVVDPNKNAPSGTVRHRVCSAIKVEF